MSHRLATLDRDGWELESGVGRHLEAPETFWIPPEAERADLPPGSVVKLLFRLREPQSASYSVERMWVYVTRRDGEYYHGCLQTEPAGATHLRPGSELVFLPKHVIDIAGPPPDDWQPILARGQELT